MPIADLMAKARAMAAHHGQAIATAATHPETSAVHAERAAAAELELQQALERLTAQPREEPNP